MKKKLVNVDCAGVFDINGVHFSGCCRKIILDTDEIAIALENHAKVEEIMLGNYTVPLDFSNYMKDNGIPAIQNIDAEPSYTQTAGKQTVETIVDPEWRKKHPEKPLNAPLGVQVETPVINVSKKETVQTTINSNAKVENKVAAPVATNNQKKK